MNAARRVILSADWPLARALAGALVVTPQALAARALGVEPLSLRDLAVGAVGAGVVVGAARAALLWRAALQAAAPDLDAAEAGGFAAAWAPALREVLQASPGGAGLGALQASPRGREAAAIVGAYRAGLSELGLIDPAELYAAAAVAYAVGPARPQVVDLIGYAGLCEAELDFLDALAAPGSRLSLPYAAGSCFAAGLSAARRLEERGWTVELDEPAGHWSPRAASVTAAVYPTPDDEWHAVLNEVRGLVRSGVPAASIAVVAQSPGAVLEALGDLAAEFGLRVAATCATPLAATRLGAWLTALLYAAAGDFPYAATRDCLTHPLGPGLSGPAAVRVVRRTPSGAAAWRECGVELGGLLAGPAAPGAFTAALRATLGA